MTGCSDSGRPDRPSVAVAGLGAMGILFAARLAVVGCEVHGIVRTPAQADVLRQQGIHLTETGGGHLAARLASVAVAGETDPVASVQRPDLIIVAVKAHATAAIAPILGRLLGRDTLVLTVQNGLGNAEALMAGGIPAQRLILGTTTEAATRIGPAHSRHFGEGGTVIGPYRPSADAVAPARGETRPAAWLTTLLGAAGFAVTWQDEIEPHIWTKLAVNVAINPVSALLGVRNGLLREDDGTLALMKTATQETASVAAANGIDLGAARLWQAVLTVLNTAAANQSSMLQDRLAGRPTEIDALCGAVVRQAGRHGLKAPVNELLHTLVNAMERLTWGRGDPPSRSTGQG